jgi:hypothetical protein
MLCYTEVNVVNAKLLMRLVGVVAVGMMLTTMAHAEWKWSGYTQIRLNTWDSNYGDSKPSSDFLARRARIKLVGDVDPDTNLALQIDFANLVNDESTSGSGNVELKDALITRKLRPELSATMGYTQVPFGYEVPSSDSANYLFEKSQPVQKFFPGERDTGLYLHYRPTKTSTPQVDLGYSNGLHKWYDVSGGNRDSGSRAVVGRVQWPLNTAGVAGLSYMWADRDRGAAGGATTNFGSQNVLGLHARYTFNPKVTLQAEYFDGKYLNNVTEKDAKGWYGTALYTFCPKPVTAFYRYDALDSGDPDNFSRHTIGLAYDQSKNQRYSLQVEDIRNDGAGKDFTNFAVQWQVKY